MTQTTTRSVAWWSAKKCRVNSDMIKLKSCYSESVSKLFTRPADTEQH